MRELWLKFREFLEVIYDPQEDLGRVSQEHLYDINAACKRNVWFDKKGNRWPLRDAL